MVLDNIRPPVIPATNPAKNSDDTLKRVSPELTSERSVSSTPSVEEPIASTSESGASTAPSESVARPTSANEFRPSSAASDELSFGMLSIFCCFQP